MVDPELLRKALYEQLRALADSGVTHLAHIDWESLFPEPAVNSARPAHSLNPSPGSLPPTNELHAADSPPISRTNQAASTAATATPAIPARPAPVATRPTLVADLSQTDLSPYGAAISSADRPNALTVLQTEVSACRCCPELVRNRKQTVFGVGNPQARLCFLGEAPGQEEDAKGEPFVGPAGQLLDKIITASKLRREDVFILNTVKCRPPMNRTPFDSEVEQCWHFAHRQLEIIQPEFICCLGAVAAKSLLRTSRSIGQLRGSFHRYRGSQVVVTYHPAYLLRTPSAKKHVWEDMKMLMRAMGVEL
jgi:DNA polymerase